MEMSADCRSDTAVANDADTEATSLARTDVAVEMPADDTAFVDCNADT